MMRKHYKKPLKVCAFFALLGLISILGFKLLPRFLEKDNFLYDAHFLLPIGYSLLGVSLIMLVGVVAMIMLDNLKKDPKAKKRLRQRK